MGSGLRLSAIDGHVDGVLGLPFGKRLGLEHKFFAEVRIKIAELPRDRFVGVEIYTKPLGVDDARTGMQWDGMLTARLEWGISFTPSPFT